MDGEPNKETLKPKVLVWSNPDGDMPSAIHAATKRDTVSHVPDGLSADIEDVGLLIIEFVPPLRRYEHEEPAMSDVLNAGSALSLSSRPRPLRDVEVVPLDELGIHHTWILMRRDLAGHVEPVAMLYVRQATRRAPNGLDDFRAKPRMEVEHRHSRVELTRKCVVSP